MAILLESKDHFENEISIDLERMYIEVYEEETGWNACKISDADMIKLRDMLNEKYPAKN